MFGIFAVIQLTTKIFPYFSLCRYPNCLWIHLTNFSLHIAIQLKSEGIFVFVKKNLKINIICNTWYYSSLLIQADLDDYKYLLCTVTFTGNGVSSFLKHQQTFGLPWLVNALQKLPAIVFVCTPFLLNNTNCNIFKSASTFLNAINCA